jgi:hypothetical protein
MSLKINPIKIQNEINKKGFIVLKDFLSKSLCNNLYNEIMNYNRPTKILLSSIKELVWSITFRIKMKFF